MEPVVRPLGEPEDDDVVLLNVVASLENVLGNYERAQKLFEKLRLLEPDNETIIQNYSATLTGLKQYTEAINLLEDHLPLSETPREYVHRLLPLISLSGLDQKMSLINLIDAYLRSARVLKRREFMLI